MIELIEIEELEVGDEIVISCQSHFKYLRILKKPVLNTAPKPTWRNSSSAYKSVKCSTIRTTTVHTWTANNGKVCTRTTLKWGFGSEDHNFKMHVNLNYKQIILIKKKI